MRWIIACLVIGATIMTLACQKPVAYAEVGHDSNGEIFVQHFVPSDGGIMEWSRAGTGSFQIQRVGDGWPCDLQQNNDQTVTCKFPKTDNPQVWEYLVLPPGKNAQGAGTTPPGNFLFVGHCNNCSGVVKGGHHPKHNRDQNVNGPYGIYCDHGKATVDTPEIHASSGDVVMWQVTGTGSDSSTGPTATLAFDDPQSCTPSPVTGATPSCTVQKSGTYTYIITKVPGCAAASPGWKISVQ